MDVRTEGVEAAIDGNQILHGVDIEAQDGKLVGLIGPNGSGKSTLLRCIYRTLEPTAGAVYLDSKLLGECSMRESALKVGVLAQHNYYNFEFSVEEVVLMGRAPHKKPLARDDANDMEIVADALAMVGMAKFRERSFSTLSGGEQQRVILARALAQQTPCLILDEPTNHLDIKYQLQLMDLICGLGKTVIAAIHDLNIAAMYCDTLYAMKSGKIVAIGTPEEVLTRERIRELYEVDATVFRDSERGLLRILYHPDGNGGGAQG